MAVTMGEVVDDELSDGEDSTPVWAELRDHVNNCIHDVDRLLDDLRTMHRSELSGFGVEAVQQKSENLATRITAKIKEAERSINLVYPRSQQKKKGQETVEELVRIRTLVLLCGGGCCWCGCVLCFCFFGVSRSPPTHPHARTIEPGQVKRNVQTELSQKLYRVTMQFRGQQKQFIHDKLVRTYTGWVVLLCQPCCCCCCGCCCYCCCGVELSLIHI